MTARLLLGDILRIIRLRKQTDDLASVERLLPLLREPKHVPGRIDWQGAPLHFADAPSLYYQLAEIYGKKIYDFPADGRLPRPPRILDVGGNIGVACRRFRQLHPAAELISFEPDPALANLMQKNLAAIGDRQTEVVAAAAWTHQGTIGFHVTGDDSGSIQPEAELQVLCIDLGSYLGEPVDFLKLDVEGAEYDLMVHLDEQGLLSNVRRLFLELHQWRTQHLPRFGEIFEILTRNGFDHRIREAELFPANASWETLPQTSTMLLVQAWRK